MRRTLTNEASRKIRRKEGASRGIDLKTGGEVDPGTEDAVDPRTGGGAGQGTGGTEIVIGVAAAVAVAVEATRIPGEEEGVVV